MKKNVSRMLSVILAICMVVSLMPSVWANESADTVEILMLDTSDIHGQLYATDYTAEASASGTYRQGLTRVATYIKEMREQYPNFFLADTGDTVQGTPLTYYFAFEEHTMADPTVKAMRTLGYDMWVLGNHEFNYGMKILTEQVDYAISESTESEKQITMSMANYLAAETNSDESKDWATWRGFDPYIIKEYDGVKVAIMGLGNPGIPMWDVPENWAGLYFANPIETYDHYEAEMLEKADMIVIMTHSGVGGNGSDGTGYMEELVKTHDSIDLVFSGHEHRDGVTNVTDTAGKMVPIVSPSSKCNKIGQALVTFNKADGTCTVEAKNVNMRNYAIDEELDAVLAPYEKGTWEDYMLRPIGKASGDFSASGLGDAPSAFMDLINQVQLAYAYDYNGQNTPDDPTDDTMAQLSISAPLTSGSAANIIPAGDIVLGDLFKLYRYENWFYQITMTGKEVKTWLEFAATNVNSNGNAGNLTYYDVIYGDGFYYEIDCARAKDHRVINMTYNGVPVTDDQVFTVVVNNYRYNGGGGYVDYLNAHGCEFIANDENRIIYSTQYDMIQGEDQGQARNMLANYIREKGTIDPEITSTWKIVKSEVPETYEFALVSTTDMHGRSTEYDVATQKLDNNSMLKAATIIKDIRASYGDNMVLIDNGDTIQGNLVAQYAINQKADVLNPMMEIMMELGYDTWTMGNHEFNFNPDQRDTQAKFSLESGMTAIAANINLLTDGKNMFGEDVKAGDPFYAPYVVKTLTDDYGRTVNVAVIGMGNPANATWDLASNYPNMQFSALDNPEGDLAFEFQKWIDIVNEKEDVDVIVIASHNGTGDAENPSLENQSMYAALNSTGADLVISGHDHTPTLRVVENNAGETVRVVNAGGSTVNLNTFTVTFDDNGKVADVSIESENIALSSVNADKELAARNQHWYDETYAWASAPVGSFDNGWSDIADQFTGKNNDHMVTFQNALVDFVHKAQIWCSWQSFEELGIEGATVSIGSAVFGTSGGALSFVPRDGDTISTLELNKLYRYSNNLLCAIDMTGEQLWNWMNTTVDYYDVDANGKVCLNSSVFGTDTFYGVDYTIDLTRPYGQRLVKATYQGQDLKTYEGTIRCVLNSYRLSGGYGFYEATGLTEADCCWTASMYLGSDRAPVPTQLGEYVAHMGTVTPNDPVSHGADSTWKIVTERTYDNPFTDVSEDQWFYEPIMELVDAGIVNGTSETTFTPDKALTRAEWVTLLWRAAGRPEATVSAGFTDVKQEDFFYMAFTWAAEKGIVQGVGGNMAAPYALINREQMVTMLYRLSGEETVVYDLGGYTDVNDVSYFAVDAFEWAVAKGYINGMTLTTLAPQAGANRAQAVTVLYRYLNG